MALNSDNVIVRTIINVGLNDTHSIMGGNWRHLRYKYGIEECNVINSWDEKYTNECESFRECVLFEMCLCSANEELQTNQTSFHIDITYTEC